MGDQNSYRNMGFSGNDARTLAWTREVNAQNAKDARQGQAARGREAQSRRSARGRGAGAASSELGGQLVGAAMLGLLGLGLAVMFLNFVAETVIPWFATNWLWLLCMSAGYGVLAYAVHRRAVSAKLDYLIPELLVLAAALAIYAVAPPSDLRAGIFKFGPHFTALIVAWLIPLLLKSAADDLLIPPKWMDRIADKSWYWPLKIFTITLVAALVAVFASELIHDIYFAEDRSGFWFDAGMGWLPFVTTALVFTFLFGLIALRAGLIGLRNASKSIIRDILMQSTKGMQEEQVADP